MESSIRIVAFGVASLLFAWVSRRSLGRPSAHGFSRFFAFEAILALVLINAPRWFADPFGARQLVSWILLGVSLVFVVWGFALLRSLGGANPPGRASPVFEWENTGRLVTSGIYRHIRHPMYSSLLFLAWGTFLKSMTVAAFVLAGTASLALVAAARAEEAENLAKFGSEYRDYMLRTARFLPFLL
jgi:protein-S-isoprenylcysteine O-methyltransferase Ste14